MRTWCPLHLFFNLLTYLTNRLASSSVFLVNCARFARSHYHHLSGLGTISPMVMVPCDFSAHDLTRQTDAWSKAHLVAWDCCPFILRFFPWTPSCSGPKLTCITFNLTNSHTLFVWLSLKSFGFYRFQPGVYGTWASLDFSVPFGDSHSREFFLVGALGIFCTADSQLPAVA